MSIEHKNITDPNVHEPKGISTAVAGQQYVADGAGGGSWTFPEPKGVPAAAAGEAYIADGAGSGSFKRVQVAQYACMRATALTQTTGITGTYKAFNNASLGGTITWTDNISEGLTLGLTDGYIEALEAGVYHVSAALNFKSVSNNSSFEFTLGVAAGAGPIVTKEASVFSKIDTSGVADSVNCTLTCIPYLNAGDRLYLMVRETVTTPAKQLIVSMFNLVVTRVD